MPTGHATDLRKLPAVCSSPCLCLRDFLAPLSATVAAANPVLVFLCSPCLKPYMSPPERHAHTPEPGLFPPAAATPNTRAVTLPPPPPPPPASRSPMCSSGTWGCFFRGSDQPFLPGPERGCMRGWEGLGRNAQHGTRTKSQQETESRTPTPPQLHTKPAACPPPDARRDELPTSLPGPAWFGLGFQPEKL